MNNLIKQLVQLLIIAVVVLQANQLQAQIRVLPPDSGYIFTFINPSDDYRVKINGELQEETNRFALKRGTYHVSVWAPYHEVWDTTITLDSKRVRVAHALTPKKELVEYRQNLDDFSRYKGRAIVGGVGTVLFGAAAIFNYNRVGDLNYDLMKAENGLKFGFEGYNDEIVSDAENKHKNAQTLQYVIYGGMALSTGFAVYNYIKMKKLGLPKLNEDKAFLVEGFGVGVNQYNNPQFYTSIRF